MVGQGTCPLPQGFVAAACEGSGHGRGERLALHGCTGSAFLGQDVRVVLIWPGLILPVGRLSLMPCPEHPCFIDHDRAVGHSCILQQLPLVG